MPRNSGHTAGEGAELSVAGHLIEEYDCRISVPHGESHQYDIIADYKHELLKIQVKKATHEKSKRYSIDTEGYTEDEVDLFAGYVSELDEVFYVPFRKAEERGDYFSVSYASLDDEGVTEYHLKKAYRADDYTFGKAISRMNIE